MQVGVSASPIMRDSGDDNVRFVILSFKTTDEPKAGKKIKKKKKKPKKNSAIAFLSIMRGEWNVNQRVVILVSKLLMNRKNKKNKDNNSLNSEDLTRFKNQRDIYISICVYYDDDNMN